MHSVLQHAHSWLCKGPLSVPGLCDIVVDYANCWVANVPHGSSFLIIGKRRTGKKTLLRDLLQRRSYHYRHGEIVTRSDLRPVGPIQVKQDIENSSIAFLERMDVWIGHELRSNELRSQHLSRAVRDARHLQTDVILCTQYVLDSPPSFRHNIDIVFAFADSSLINRKRLYEEFFRDCYADFSEFESDFNLATRDLGCLCVDRRNSVVVHFKAVLEVKTALKCYSSYAIGSKGSTLIPQQFLACIA